MIRHYFPDLNCTIKSTGEKQSTLSLPNNSLPGDWVQVFVGMKLNEGIISALSPAASIILN